LPGYRIFPWIPRLLVSFGGRQLRCHIAATDRWKIVRGCPDSPAFPYLSTEPAPQYGFVDNNRTLVLRLSRGKCRGEWFTAEGAENAEKREYKLEVKSAKEERPSLVDRNLV
jgi:hypothetical protein